MSMKTSTRILAAAAALSLTTVLAACGSDAADTASSAAAGATSAAASAVASATSAAASAAESAAGEVTGSAAPDESEACKQWDQLDQQIQDQGQPADLTDQLNQIQAAAAAEGDKEAESAAKELLASEGNPAAFEEATLQMEAVCGGEREGN